MRKGNFFNGFGKYLFAVALAVLIGFCGYFYYAFGEMENTLVREKSYEKTKDVELICRMVGKMTELSGADRDAYVAALKYAAETIEADYHLTFAQVYDAELTPLIRQRSGADGGKRHDPLDYPEFVDAVKQNESGSLVYWYETPEAGGRYIHMTYRWTQPGTGRNDRYLVAVGISKFTIKESISPGVTYGAAALILVAAAFIVGAVIALCRLGHIYNMRKGTDKWRDEKSS